MTKKEGHIMFSNSKKDNLIQIRVTKAQKDIIQELSLKKGMSMTRFIFSLIEQELQKISHTKKRLKLIYFSLLIILVYFVE